MDIEPTCTTRTPEEQAIYLAIYDAFNAQLRIIAEEYGVVSRTHRYPCMTVQILIKNILKKYAPDCRTVARPDQTQNLGK